MNTYTVTIVTPEKTVFKGEVVHLKAKNSQGYFGILASHAPFITSLDPGDVFLTFSHSESDVKKFLLGGGCLKLYKNNCLILADSIL